MPDTPQRRKGDFETHETGTFKMIGETSLQIATAVGLLEHARCPNLNCSDGVLQALESTQDCADSEPYFTVEQCQWCDMRKEFISDNTE